MNFQLRKYYFLYILCLLCHVPCIVGMHRDMHGMYGPYPLGRDSTGTSWVPASTRASAIHIYNEYNDWLLMMHGYLFTIYDHQGGPRGANKFFSENMFMLTAQKDFACSTFAFRGMISLEPGTIGACGYPLLLQTGETCDGITPLIDRQHPHDFWMELALVYTHIISDVSSVFIYFGLPGEPAIGPTAYIDRFSAFYNPEAPIMHHWLDSTHIQFGVLTLGFVYDWFKIDASIFTGRDPDQHRWDFDKPRFDSYAIRLAANWTDDIAVQYSYAFLKSLEQLHPNVDTHRITASITYNKAWDMSNWQTTFAFGMNKNVPGNILPGFLCESAYEYNDCHVFFGRAEYVVKDELFIEPDPRAGCSYDVGKLDAGYMFEFPLVPCTQWGLGFVFSASFVPDSLQEVYGGTPFSYMLFLRVELRE